MNAGSESERTSNPYAPPKRDVVPTVEESLARFRLRITLLILLPPAVVNLIFWDLYLVQPLPSGSAWIARTVNLILFTAVVLGSWVFGYALLQWVTRVLHRMLAEGSEEKWLGALAKSLTRLALVAIAGSLLWFVWDIGYFQMRLSGMWFSTTLVALAHIAAATWYLPLFAEWYSIERRQREAREPSRQMENEK